MNVGSSHTRTVRRLGQLDRTRQTRRAPIRALSLIEPAREDLQAYLDEIERTSSARPAWS
jgi:hypothetical protein